ncbi:universal stress protein [Saccharospirillum salsuginis]|uniref:Universal stress protein n=1 Tax=Saccharospirillum salsuginis TaxID=418750 RepID=A0A918N8U3_9GAMM|nr:universal stress protein [Saccharospirillum salsuginis]GGX48919.1 universal stress protein [Saccharospirillum salsuginis]
MFAPSHILLYSQPELNQDSALRQARQLCLAFGARLTVMTVLREPSVHWRFSTRLPDAATLKNRLREQADNELTALADDFGTQGIDATAYVAFGKPLVEVVRRVQSESVDLIVLAGETPDLEHRLLGSLAQHLIRKAPCPVWVVRRGVHQPPRQLLAAVDLNQDDPGDESNKRRSLNPHIIETADAIRDRLQTACHLVQASQLDNESFLQIHGGLDPVAIERMKKDLARSLLSRLTHLGQTTLGERAAQCQIHVEPGPATEVIDRMVRNLDIDLLVLGTLSRSGVAGLLIGNTAESLLQSVDCSILALKPPGFETPIQPD